MLRNASIVAIGALFASTAWSQADLTDSVIENRAEEVYSDPHEYEFDSSSDVEELSFDSTRRLRICLKSEENMVPLKIESSGRSQTINPGECSIVEAKELTVQPAEDVKPGISIGWSYQEENQG